MAIPLKKISMLLGHLCLHNIYNILWHPSLPHLSATEVHQAVVKLKLDFKRPNIVLFVVHPWRISQDQFRNVLFTGMLHQLYSSWSSLTTCVHTKQKVTIETTTQEQQCRGNSRKSIIHENKLRKIKARLSRLKRWLN